MKYLKAILVIMLLTYSISFAKGISIEVVPSGPAGIRGEGPNISEKKNYESNTDIIVLKNGDTIEGNVIGYSNGIYRVKIGGFVKPINETTIKTINDEYINEKENTDNSLKKHLSANIFRKNTQKRCLGDSFTFYYSEENIKKIIITNKGIKEKKIEFYERQSVCSNKRYNFCFSKTECSIFWSFMNLSTGIYDKQKDKYYVIKPNNNISINQRIALIPLLFKDNKFYCCLLEYEVGYNAFGFEGLKTNKSNIYDVYCFDYTKSKFPTGPIATCKIDKDINLIGKPYHTWWQTFFDEQAGLFKFFNNDKNDSDIGFFKVYNVEIDKTGNYEIKFNKKLKIDFSESDDKGNFSCIKYNYGYFIDKIQKHYLMAYCRYKYHTITNKTQLYVSVKLFDETKQIIDEDINILIDGNLYKPQIGVCDIDEDGLNEIIVFTNIEEFAVIKIK